MARTQGRPGAQGRERRGSTRTQWGSRPSYRPRAGRVLWAGCSAGLSVHECSGPADSLLPDLSHYRLMRNNVCLCPSPPLGQRVSVLLSCSRLSDGPVCGGTRVTMDGHLACVLLLATADVRGGVPCGLVGSCDCNCWGPCPVSHSCRPCRGFRCLLLLATLVTSSFVGPAIGWL